jgi:cell division protein FtsZ
MADVIAQDQELPFEVEVAPEPEPAEEPEPTENSEDEHEPQEPSTIDRLKAWLEGFMKGVSE